MFSETLYNSDSSNETLGILHVLKYLLILFFSAVNGEIPNINFRENGYLYLADYKGKNQLEKNNKIQRSCGVDWIDLFTSKELGKII